MNQLASNILCLGWRKGEGKQHCVVVLRLQQQGFNVLSMPWCSYTTGHCWSTQTHFVRVEACLCDPTPEHSYIGVCHVHHMLPSVSDGAASAVKAMHSTPLISPSDDLPSWPDACTGVRATAVFFFFMMCFAKGLLWAAGAPPERDESPCAVPWVMQISQSLQKQNHCAHVPGLMHTASCMPPRLHNQTTNIYLSRNMQMQDGYVHTKNTNTNTHRETHSQAQTHNHPHTHTQRKAH